MGVLFCVSQPAVIALVAVIAVTLGILAFTGNSFKTPNSPLTEKDKIVKTYEYENFIHVDEGGNQWRIIDKEEKCQYLVIYSSSGNSITPRNRKDGTQVCG